MEVLATVLEYTGSLIAGTYGVYATLTDFKEESKHRDKFPRLLATLSRNNVAWQTRRSHNLTGNARFSRIWPSRKEYLFGAISEGYRNQGSDRAQTKRPRPDLVMGRLPHQYE